MNWFVRLELLLAIIALRAASIHSSCPCNDAPIEHEHYSGDRNLNFSTTPLILCVEGKVNSAVRSILLNLRLTNITVEFVGFNNNIQTECNALLKVVHVYQTNTLSDRRLCPGVCRPVPEIQVPHTWFESELFDVLKNDSLLTCTLTSSMVSYDNTANRDTPSVPRNPVLGIFLSALFWRRVMECYEKKFWGSRYSEQWRLPFKDTASASSTVQNRNKEQNRHAYAIPKRPIRTIIIWTGSQNRIKLIEAQANVLSGHPIGGVDAVIGWAATDETYPCRSKGIKCLGGLGRYKYLPSPAINFMPKGWGCAQRRPLRSLAHILTLVDPTYVIVLDDDTYLNYNLLIQKYGDYLTTGAMSRNALVIGELGGSWGDTGHLSKYGIFMGGAGYVLGRKTVEALAAYEVKHFKGESQVEEERNINDSDTYRSNKHILTLSISREGYENSAKYCTNAQKPVVSTYSCVPSTVPYVSNISAESHVLPIAVTLIEFCANLMANENTCHHSDHSMGRCLLYGAFADPVSAACHSTAPGGSPIVDPFYPSEPSGVKIGFCFMTPACNASQQLTCHRYKPDLSTYAPVRISAKEGHYKIYSTSFNGSYIDSHM